MPLIALNRIQIFEVLGCFLKSAQLRHQSREPFYLILKDVTLLNIGKGDEKHFSSPSVTLFNEVMRLHADEGLKVFCTTTFLRFFDSRKTR